MQLAVLLFVLQIPAVSCGDAAECRRMATEAAARGDAEAFHDLAWRAVQKGKPNDADLMFLLARAQSLSGRPGDALVMLTRIAALGPVPDVTSDPDFARVRALAGWPELEARLAGRPAAPAVTPPASAPPPPAGAAASEPAPPAAPPPVSEPAAPSPGLTFSAPGLDPVGLAHDTVSRRFVLGDRRTGRLLVIDEVSRNVVSYVSPATAGFYDRLEGFTVDPRRGDLWVVSSKGDGAAAASVLHKLQLVSGRLLSESVAPKRTLPLRLVAVTVADDGSVYALDAADSRVFRLRPGARTLEQVVRLSERGATALTSAGDATLYVATAKGVVHVDLASRRATPVKTVEVLTKIESLAWRSGALLGVQRAGDSTLVIRVQLDAAGTRGMPRQILAASPSAAVAGLAPDGLYYLSADQIIRRLPLR